MSKITLLNKYKNNIDESKKDSNIKSFLDIFKELEQEYISGKKPIPEDQANEIIELGDFLENVENIKMLKEFSIFKDIYKNLKHFNADNHKNFYEECDSILCSLNGQEVRQIETLYKLLLEINLDKEFHLIYSDGINLSYKIPLESEGDMKEVLENKSFLARALKKNAVFICDFFDFEKEIIYTSGFVFDKGEWFPLKVNFLKKIHTLDNVKQEFLVANTEN